MFQAGPQHTSYVRVISGMYRQSAVRGPAHRDGYTGIPAPITCHRLQVSDEDIENYEAEYRGSEQEAEELLELYTSHRGHMDTVSMLS